MLMKLKIQKATKLNTRVIGIPSNENDDENKENCPPPVPTSLGQQQSSTIPTTSITAPPTDPPIRDQDYDQILHSLNENTTDWMNFFSSPKNRNSPNSKTPVDIQNGLTTQKSPTKNSSSNNNNVSTKSMANMPSSPYQSSNLLPSDDQDQKELNDEINKMINISPFKSTPEKANRLDTTTLMMSLHQTNKGKSGSSPSTDFFTDELHKISNKYDNEIDKENDLLEG